MNSETLATNEWPDYDRNKDIQIYSQRHYKL